MAAGCSSGWATPIRTDISYFEPNSWRRGPVPEASRHPLSAAAAAGNPADRRSLDAQGPRARLSSGLAKLEAAGYPHDTLLISMTNEWRIDGDPPFPPLADFVAAWHRLGLKPTLRLTTVSTALKTAGGRNRRPDPGIGGRMDRLVGQRRGLRSARGVGQPAGQAGGRGGRVERVGTVGRQRQQDRRRNLRAVVPVRRAYLGPHQ